MAARVIDSVECNPSAGEGHLSQVKRKNEANLISCREMVPYPEI